MKELFSFFSQHWPWIAGTAGVVAAATVVARDLFTIAKLRKEISILTLDLEHRRRQEEATIQRPTPQEILSFTLAGRDLYQGGRDIVVSRRVISRKGFQASRRAGVRVEPLAVLIKRKRRSIRKVALLVALTTSLLVVMYILRFSLAFSLLWRLAASAVVAIGVYYLLRVLSRRFTSISRTRRRLREERKSLREERRTLLRSRAS